MFRYCLLLLTGLNAVTLAQELHAQSFYPVRLEDKAAVYLSETRFGVKGDGVSDDTDALQKAIDTVADTTHQGIVFIPQGHYRLTRTLYVWPGVRLIGYGAQPPDPRCPQGARIAVQFVDCAHDLSLLVAFAS